MENTKVYLAGGLKSNWQDKVIDRLKGRAIFFDPRQHGLESDEKQFTVWDLHHVKNSNLLFVYIEKDCPSFYGASLEIGYAKALGKTIILVDEKSESDTLFARQFRMILASVDIKVGLLEEGIQILKKFLT